MIEVKINTNPDILPIQKEWRLICTMLRQQQAEIEALKKELALQRLSDIGQAIEQEPVAWMVESDDDVSFIMCGKGFAKPDESWNKVTPVYTHPVKELTDEEIMQVCSQIEPFDDTTIEQAFIEFARAILKKASEK